MSIDSKESIAEKSEEIIEDNESSMEVEEEQSQENNNFVKGSRVAKAAKNMEAMEAIEKGVNKYSK